MTGLIGWWPLNEDSGNTAYDLSGNGNHGTLNGGIVQGVAGKGGLTSYSFDGNNDYADIGSTPSNLQLGSIEESTMSAWVKIKDSNSRNWIMGAWNSSGRGFQLRVSDFDNNGDQEAVIFFRNPNNGNSDYISGSKKIDDDNWHHIVGIRKGVDSDDNSNLKLYVDGEEETVNQSSSQGAGTFNSNANFNTGRDPRGQAYMDGQMTDLRAYNRTLTPEEIQELYEWGKGDYARPLNDQNSSSAVSRWAFDGDATDSWGDNNGTETGGVGYLDDAIRGQSANLDGTDDMITFQSVPVSENSITVSYWVNYDNTNSVEYTVNNYSGTSSSDQWFILGVGHGSDITDGNWGFQVDDGSNNPGVDSGVSAKSGWHHITGTYDGSTLVIYINGIEIARKTVSLNSIDFSSFQVEVGYSSDGNPEYTDGKIDDVRIYDKALNDQEVFELYRWGTRGRDMRKLTVNSR